MRIESSAFANEGDIPDKYTCVGTGVNPPLKISGVPAGARSLVLVMDDPDAPGGSFIHWTLWNIPPTVKEIAENQVPAGAVEGTTSAGTVGYVSPCPPSGLHHYRFKLFALDYALMLSGNADIVELERGLEGHILEKVELMGVYQSITS